MISRRVFISFLVLSGASVILASCAKSEDISFRYRLKAEVETPEGIRTGGSVLRVVVFGRLAGTEGLGGGGARAQGEAVAIDLPNGQTLFVLLRSQDNVDWAAEAFQRASEAASGRRFNDGDPEPAAYVSMVKGDRAEYVVRRWAEFPNGKRKDVYPMLVTFKDIADPTSVERVDPDNLAASFGKDYRLKAITVQVTDAPVTTGIEKRLHAIGVLPDNSLDKDFAPTTSPTLAQSLGYRDFVRK